jgi:hypothetical protein
MKWHGNAIENKIIPEVDLFISVNDSLINYFKNYHNIKKTMVIMNFPITSEKSDTKFDFRLNYEWELSDIIFLYQGVFNQGRGLELLIDLFNKLPDNYKLILIGEGSLKNQLEKLCVKHKLTDVTLIDGSDKQFANLVENYKNQYHVKTLNTVVTVDGSDVEWYQGGEGYTDTVVPSVINSWLDSSEIIKSYRKSVSINDLMKDKNYDWLHLDVEGLDGDLILALESKPNLIIYEDENLDIITKTKLDAWFLENSYTTIKHKCNIIAVKNG